MPITAQTCLLIFVIIWVLMAILHCLAGQQQLLTYVESPFVRLPSSSTFNMNGTGDCGALSSAIAPKTILPTLNWLYLSPTPLLLLPTIYHYFYIRLRVPIYLDMTLGVSLKWNAGVVAACPRQDRRHWRWIITIVRLIIIISKEY